MKLNFRPNFEKGLILKQYMLEALRDYPESYIELLYSNMGDGIITGLEISVVGESIFCIKPGIVKNQDKVYIFQGKTNLEFSEGERYVYLKIKEEKQVDGIKYKMDIIQTEQETEEFLEIFRYIKNAKMKEYTNINELFLENRPTNRIDTSYSKQSIEGGNTVRKEYFILYARKIIEKSNATIRDVAFAYECMNGIYNIEILKSYFETEQLDNETIFQLMKKRLSELELTLEKKEVQMPEKSKTRKTIIS